MCAVKARALLHHGKYQHCLQQPLATVTAPDNAEPQQYLWWLDMLVQSFADARNFCSARARRVLLTDDLPPALARIAARIRLDRQIWVAWTDGQCIRFVIAEAAPNVSGVAIHLFFLDIDGQLQASGIWVLHAQGIWSLHTVDTAKLLSA